MQSPLLVSSVLSWDGVYDPARLRTFKKRSWCIKHNRGACCPWRCLPLWPNKKLHCSKPLLPSPSVSCLYFENDSLVHLEPNNRKPCVERTFRSRTTLLCEAPRAWHAHTEGKIWHVSGKKHVGPAARGELTSDMSSRNHANDVACRSA